MRYILILFILLLASPVFAGTYYVEDKGTYQLNQQDDGQSAFDASSDVAHPCSAATGMAHAIAGDTVYFRGGTYQLQVLDGSTFYWYNGVLNPANSGTSVNPITFQAYSGETPTMNTTRYDTSRQEAPAFGVNGQSYIIFDGFTFTATADDVVGGIKLMTDNVSSGYGTEGDIIRNCYFPGMRTPYENSNTTNWPAVFIQECNGCTVENSIFHSIREGQANYHNITAIVMYHDGETIIRNNEFYDNSMSVWIKSDNENTYVYNNYFHDSFAAILGQVYSTINSDGVYIYNNVIVNMDECGIDWANEEDSSHGNDFTVYNNTIYNIASKRGITTSQCESGHGAVVYNNIVQSTNTLFFPTMQTNYSGYIKECDHNNLTPPMTVYVDGWNTTYTTLSSWQSSGELEGGGNPGVESLSTDPLFVNDSGNLNQLSDFYLQSTSPCVGAGRDGVNMGANIDMVGVNPGLDCGDYDGDQPACESNGCIYCSADDTCGSTECCGDSAPQCDDQTSCEDAGWNWCTDVCQEDECAGPPPECINCVYLDGPGRVDLN